MDFLEILVDCRNDLGDPGHRFSWWARMSSSLNAPKPPWATPEKDLHKFYEQFHEVLANGYVTWGHIVQANTGLFEKGEDPLPGEVIYCTDSRVVVPPDTLGRLAESLFQLKGTTPDDPQLRAIADHLTDERTVVFGFPVPVEGEIRFALSATMFHRHHLPAGMLTVPFLPIVVSTTGSGVVVPLPYSFWPREFEHWCRGTPTELIDMGPARVNYRKWLTTVLSWDATIALVVVLIPVLLAFLLPQRTVAIEVAATVLPILGVLARLYFGVRHVTQNHCGAALQLLQLIALLLAVLAVFFLEVVAVITMENRGNVITRIDEIASFVTMVVYFLLVIFAMYPGKGWD